MEHVVVVGAGPVGVAAALMLAKEDSVRKIDVYDRAPAIPSQLNESYPIGVNRRGMRTLNMLGCEDKVKEQGVLVDAWKIFVKTFNVASVQSGQCWGTTRGIVNQVIFDELQHEEKITVHFSHKLTSVDFTTKTLHFEQLGGENDREVVGKVEVTADKLIACDGIWSATRTALKNHWDELKVDVYPWERKFRCLYSEKQSTKLDPANHYILTGIYTAVLKNNFWSFTVGWSPNSKDDQVFTSTEPSKENVEYLRAHLKKLAPQIEDHMLSDEDLEAFFRRKVFGGAIVKVSHLQYNNWLVLLGDAAHSVYPATGEGINSGLEDVYVLEQTLQQAKQHQQVDEWFSLYEAVRYTDTCALADYAMYVEGAATRDDKAHKVSHTIASITSFLGSKIGKPQPSKEELLFGAASKDGPYPYSEVIAKWKKTLWLEPKLYNLFTTFSKERKGLLFETDKPQKPEHPITALCRRDSTAQDSPVAASDERSA